jgi:hypothetical protein
MSLLLDMSRGKGKLIILPGLPLNYSITGEMDHSRSRRCEIQCGLFCHSEKWAVPVVS